MADQPVCQRHGRPAVASRVHTRPDGTQEVEYLCEIDVAEERMRRLGGRRASSTTSSPISSAIPVPAPGAHAQFSSARWSASTSRSSSATPTRELLQRAAQTALGGADLDTDHPVRRAPGRRRTARARADRCRPAAIAALEEEAEMGERTDVAPSLAPDAKAALAAYEESRELGSSYVGPEHVLLALARTPIPRQGSCSSVSASPESTAGGPSSAASRAALRRKRRRHPSWTSSAVT